MIFYSNFKGFNETQNLASKFYEAFVGNAHDFNEFEKNDDTITKEESRSRILLLLHISASRNPPLIRSRPVLSFVYLSI